MSDIKFDIYEENKQENLRFVLGTKGEKPLFVIGLNPSTATDIKSDTTISKINEFAKRNNFDSFLMLNLYPLRTPFPKELKEFDQNIHIQNINQIKIIIKNYNEINILAAWGNNIFIKDYLLNCLFEINESLNNLKINWLQIGTLTKEGHPRHPSRVGYINLEKFEIENYIKKWNKI